MRDIVETSEERNVVNWLYAGTDERYNFFVGQSPTSLTAFILPCASGHNDFKVPTTEMQMSDPFLLDSPDQEGRPRRRSVFKPEGASGDPSQHLRRFNFDSH